MEVIFLGQNSNNNHTSTVNRDAASGSRFPNKFSSCKTLQRKLELKVERAKKNYSQQNGTDVTNVKQFYEILLRENVIEMFSVFCRTQKATMHRWYQSIDFQFQATLFHLLNTNQITGKTNEFLWYNFKFIIPKAIEKNYSFFKLKLQQ